MKTIYYIILLIVLGSFSAIFYGLAISDGEPTFANKCIGFGTVGLFLVAMPLFLITASRGKKMKDYMFNEENIRKMRDRDRKKTGNQ